MGEVVLADFGLAKSLPHPDQPSDQQHHRPMTNRMMTLWYRPLELLLGSTQYGPEVDMWGVGCILYELFSGKPLFSESTEIAQIQAILSRFPFTSHLERYPWSSLVDLKSMSMQDPTMLLETLLAQHMPPDAQSLALSLLSLDPAKRPSAKEALRHPFFRSDPKPSNRLPRIEGGLHEFEFKQQQKLKK